MILIYDWLKNAYVATLASSVTRRLDMFLDIWPFTKIKICPKALKVAKVGSTFCQVLNRPFTNFQSRLKVCQSGEILPNLVTMLAS